MLKTTEITELLFLYAEKIKGEHNRKKTHEQ